MPAATVDLEGYKGKRFMFTTRLLSGIVLVLVLFGLFFLGGPVLLFGMLAISLGGMFELYRIRGMERSLPGGIAYICMCLYYMNLRFLFLPEAEFLFFGFLILLLAVYVFRYPKYRFEDMALVFFGYFYVGLMLACVYRLRELEGGIYLVWLVLLCSWGCDTCAYCAGKLFGRHRMTPVLSPKKTIEGAVGGVIGAMLITALYVWVFRSPLTLKPVEIAVLSGVSGAGALLSMVGDLAASAIKRNYDIKDYGRLIPGHGGILDRFDSVIITAPVIYGLCYFVR